MLRLFFLLLPACLLLPAYGSAQTVNNAAPPSPAQAAFAQAYIKAAREQDMKQFWQLAHPASISCMSESYKDYVELDEFQAVMDKPVGEDHALQVLPVPSEEVTKYYAEEFGDTVQIPVVPPAALVISYNTERGVCAPKTLRRVIFIAPDKDGNWREVFTCPKRRSFNVESFQLEKAIEEVSYQTSSTSVIAGELKEIEKLVLQDGALGDAVKTLMKRRGMSQSVAERFVDEICIDAAK